MLSAFTARAIIELKQRDKSKIEAILAYGDRVLVGLNSGSLRVYRVNELPAPSPTNPANGNGKVSELSAQAAQPELSSSVQSAQDAQPKAPQNPPATKPTDLLREIEKFSTRAVEQLAIIKEANVLVSLSNYAVSFHDLQSFEPIESPLARTKNASTFAVTSNIFEDPATGIPEIISRLAVAVKRRLYLWSWHESELSDEVDEIVLPEAIRSVTWANATKIVCGMNMGYVLVDVQTRSFEDIVGPGAIGGAAGTQGSRFGAVSSAGMGYMGLGGYMPKPLATKLAEGELLLAKDINTLFVDDDGKALEKRQIPWQAAPEAIGYSYPYILALQAPAKGSLEVRNPDTLNLLQTISLPNAAALHFPPPTVSLAHAGKGFHVLSDRVVWKMDATDYDSQVDELIKTARYDEAVSILRMLEDALLKDKTETLREVKMLKAEALFKQKKYREAMDLFNEEEVYAPPERVLKLFPKIIAGDLSGIQEEDPKDDEDSDDQDAANGQKINGEKTTKADGPIDAASPQKGGAFAKYLMGHRKPQSDTASVHSTAKNASESDDAASVKPNRKEKPAQDDKDLKDAVNELKGYLAGARRRLQRVMDPETGSLRPRTSDDEAAAEVFRLYKSKDDEVLEKELRETFKIVDTSLFRAYMYSSPSLASALFRLPNFCDPEVVNQKLLENDRYIELIDFFYGKKLHRQALELLRRFGEPEQADDTAPTLHGPQRTIAYLQNLPPELIDLILEFSAWTLQKDRELALEIFLADSENAETLPRDKVLKFLGGIDVALEIRYLEHIITELRDTTPDYHDRLVELLIRHLKDGTKGREWDEEMESLVRFLGESKEYKQFKAFSMIPKDDPAFYEAQAVVLSQMENHKQALEIYVFKMQDYAKAEDYCNRIHKAHDTTFASPSQAAESEESEPSIYQTLLSLYLKPPPPHAPNLAPALELLSKHGSRLTAEATLSLVPDSLPVSELESYFRGRMRSANSIVNETRVVVGLRNVEALNSQAVLRLGPSISWSGGSRLRRYDIKEDQICGVCHKRLGGSVIASLPDNTVVHYGCLNRVGRRVSSGAVPQQPADNAAASRYGAWGRRNGS